MRSEKEGQQNITHNFGEANLSSDGISLLLYSIYKNITLDLAHAQKGEDYKRVLTPVGKIIVSHCGICLLISMNLIVTLGN